MEKENMDTSQQEEEAAESLLANSSNTQRGGLKTMPFIIVNESFERLASQGLMPNMIFYLMKGYHMEAATASSLLMTWSALSDGLAIFGAFLSDSYLGRFRVIAIGSFSSLLGMILLWLTAMIPQLKPSPCNQFELNCEAPKAAQITLLLLSFLLVSIGAGCIRPCSIAFGADQLNKKRKPNNERVLESYFNWYYASTGISSVLAMTLIVYIQDHLGWNVGFGIPVILMVFSALMFLVGSFLYVKVKATESLFTGFLQVLVAAFRKRKVHSSLNKGYYQYHVTQDSKFLAPADNLRCLNKACIIEDPDRDLNSDGSVLNPWRLTSVEQVESLKALLRVIPMWFTGVLLYVNLKGSFSTLQAKSMDRHLFLNFEIPAGSFNVFMVVTLTIWVAFYDRVLAPLVARHTGQPRGLSPVLRMGIGLLIACVAAAVSAVVESIRRTIAIKQGLQDDPDALVDMSAAWLLPQFALLGLAEAFNAIGQIEFFYSQFPKTMSSIAVAIFTLGMAVSSLFGSVLVKAVDGITRNGGKISWLSSNLNQGHLDYYYWLLTFLNLVNFLYFLLYCRSYQPNTHEELENESEYRRLPSA